jgi:hypothetical protein
MLNCGNIRITCCDVEVAEKGCHPFPSRFRRKSDSNFVFHFAPLRSGILI